MKTMIMTGGTAGIGLAAAQQLRQRSDVRLLVGARGKPNTDTEVLPLDLASLASVRNFAALVEERLGEAEIDALVLNAGVSGGNLDQRTEDGFEMTFAVNHLAHYLLLRLLMPRLAFGAVVVITTSDTHDPKIIPFASPRARGRAEARPGAGPAERQGETLRIARLLHFQTLQCADHAGAGDLGLRTGARTAHYRVQSGRDA